MLKKLCGRGKGISIIIPFRNNISSNHRTKNFEWLKKYWKHHLPAAELIVGIDPDIDFVFSKSAAINNAAKSATGDIFVIIDADCYLSVDTVLHAAKEIRKARKNKRRLWFIPYRKFYRLNEKATEKLLLSSPKKPYVYDTPPSTDDILDITKTNANPATAHWFGAGVQIIPLEAFQITHGWDDAFRGWGGEDNAAMGATDTLYWPHKTINTQCFHMWHPMFSTTGINEWVSWEERIWEDQRSSASNGILSKRYYDAVGNIEKMQKLVDEKLHKKIEKNRNHKICRPVRSSA